MRRVCHEQPRAHAGRDAQTVHRLPVGHAGRADLPCHLSILAAVLAGTTAGAFLVEYWVITALGLTGLFLLSLARALRAFRERS